MSGVISGRGEVPSFDWNDAAWTAPLIYLGVDVVDLPGRIWMVLQRGGVLGASRHNFRVQQRMA